MQAFEEPAKCLSPLRSQSFSVPKRARALVVLVVAVVAMAMVNIEVVVVVEVEALLADVAIHQLDGTILLLLSLVP